MTNKENIKQRLEYLRGEIQAERISYGELAELQGLTAHIEPGDVELLEAAGVPEGNPSTTAPAYNYIAQGVEVSTYMEDYEWQDSQELAVEIIEAAPGAQFLFIEAGNINWRGANGVKLANIDEDTLWQDIAGTNGDWSLKVPGKIKKATKTGGLRFEAVVSSHDVPTGGGRIVKLLTAAQMYAELLRLGFKKQEIAEAMDLFTYVIEETPRPTIAQIVEAIEYAGAEEVEAIL